MTVGYPSWTSVDGRFADDVQTLMLALGFVTTRSHHVSGHGSRLARPALAQSRDERAVARRDRVHLASASRRRLSTSAIAAQAARYDHIPVDSRARRSSRSAERPRSQGRAHGADPVWHRSLAGSLTSLYRPHGRRRTRPPARILLRHDRPRRSSVTRSSRTTFRCPRNVTYVANGFISHNTIGLMMDCDTTGIEPDLGLVKMKKLVGGGTMSIVNQTIPRALRQLGYTPQQVDDDHRLHRRHTRRSWARRTWRPSTCRCSPARWATTRSTTRVMCG